MKIINRPKKNILVSLDQAAAIDLAKVKLKEIGVDIDAEEETK